MNRKENTEDVANVGYCETFNNEKNKYRTVNYNVTAIYRLKTITTK